MLTLRTNSDIPRLVFKDDEFRLLTKLGLVPTNGLTLNNEEAVIEDSLRVWCNKLTLDDDGHFSYHHSVLGDEEIVESLPKVLGLNYNSEWLELEMSILPVYYTDRHYFVTEFGLVTRDCMGIFTLRVLKGFEGLVADLKQLAQSKQKLVLDLQTQVFKH